MEWLTSAEALTLLGTQPQTLYANVSRGRIKAKPDPADSRRSLYRADDVRRLAQRAAGRRKQEAVAAGAMRWGEPVMPTSISTVEDGHLLYRGRKATDWAEAASLEDTAALLWQVNAYTAAPVATLAGGSMRDLFLALAERVPTDPPSLGRSQTALGREAAAVHATVANGLCGTTSATGPLHVRVANHWGRPEAAEAIRWALVLLADHELNASTFAARVAASTGASLSAAVLAGLAALTGPLHGGAAVAAQALAAEAETRGAEAAIMARLGQGVPVPAFGHQLYPEGDARAAALLMQFTPPVHYRELQEAAEEITGDKANIDFALAAMTAAFGLPEDAPLTLFALARSVGWLAHALEQVSQGHLIRPRAHYMGAS